MFSSVLKVVVLSAFCGILYLVIWADAAQFGKYKVENLTCDINYGHVIARTQAHSTARCGIQCQGQTGCRSSVFNVSTETCYLNNKTKPACDMVQEGCGKELTYIERQASFGHCESNGDCIEKNLALCENKVTSCGKCMTGRCTCHYQYHYNILDNTCRSICTSYADTFEFYNKHNVGWNLKAMHSNVSLEECKEACLCEASFTCSWLSYKEVSALCTYTDTYSNGYVYTDVNVSRYRRFCADP